MPSNALWGASPEYIIRRRAHCPPTGFVRQRSIGGDILGILGEGLQNDLAVHRMRGADAAKEEASGHGIPAFPPHPHPVRLPSRGKGRDGETIHTFVPVISSPSTGEEQGGGGAGRQ